MVRPCGSLKRAPTQRPTTIQPRLQYIRPHRLSHNSASFSVDRLRSTTSLRSGRSELSARCRARGKRFLHLKQRAFAPQRVPYKVAQPVCPGRVCIEATQNLFIAIKAECRAIPIKTRHDQGVAKVQTPQDKADVLNEAHCGRSTHPTEVHNRDHGYA